MGKRVAAKLGLARGYSFGDFGGSFDLNWGELSYCWSMLNILLRL